MMNYVPTIYILIDRKAANQITRAEKKVCNYCIFQKLKLLFPQKQKVILERKLGAEHQILETVAVSHNVRFKGLLLHGINENKTSLIQSEVLT